MGLWKAALLPVAPSLLLVASAVFAFGVAWCKLLAVRSFRRIDRSARHDRAATAVDDREQTFRRIGWTITALALAYVLACLPAFAGVSETARYELPIGIAIAAIAFTELVLSIHGVWSARRNSDLLVEGVKLANLAASFVLLSLTQSAIMSFAHHGDSTVPDAVAGTLAGAAAAIVGISMLSRSARRRRAALRAGPPQHTTEHRHQSKVGTK